jgi:hypothetical protein
MSWGHPVDASTIILEYTGQILVKYWSSTGQNLVITVAAQPVAALVRA